MVDDQAEVEVVQRDSITCWWVEQERPLPTIALRGDETTLEDVREQPSDLGIERPSITREVLLDVVLPSGRGR